MNITIHPLKPLFLGSNLDAFKTIAADIPLEAWDRDNYLYELPYKWELSLVALNDEGIPAGFIIASQKEASVHIHKFAVSPEFRSTGLGSKLQEALEKRVKELSMRRFISLFVDVSNVGAIAFYRRHGYIIQQTEESMHFLTKALKKVVSIHQPNFMPWLGYFVKVANSDAFIVLDHSVMNVQSAGWVKRVTFFNSGKESFVTIPLQKGEGKFQAINEMRIDVSDKNFKKGRDLIYSIYKKHPYWSDYSPLIEAFFAQDGPELLAERNIAFNNKLLGLLGIKTEIHYSSQINAVGLKSELVANLASALGANVYLSGKGALDYNNPEDFSSRNIEIAYSSFNPADPAHQYPQKGMSLFVPGLSIVDCLMNVGAEAAAEIINPRH